MGCRQSAWACSLVLGIDGIGGCTQLNEALLQSRGQSRATGERVQRWAAQASASSSTSSSTWCTRLTGQSSARTFRRTSTGSWKPCPAITWRPPCSPKTPKISTTWSRDRTTSTFLRFQNVVRASSRCSVTNVNVTSRCHKMTVTFQQL